MLVSYVGLIHNDEDGIWIEFPDLPGCLTQGENLEDALYMAKGALECYVLGELKDGNKLPAATPLTSFSIEQCPTFIQADVDLSKGDIFVRKNCTIPKWLNEQASARNLNFSKILQEALVANL